MRSKVGMYSGGQRGVFFIIMKSKERDSSKTDRTEKNYKCISQSSKVCLKLCTHTQNVNLERDLGLRVFLGFNSLTLKPN